VFMRPVGHFRALLHVSSVSESMGKVLLPVGNSTPWSFFNWSSQLSNFFLNRKCYSWTT
jgi:hypothetical protein